MAKPRGRSRDVTTAICKSILKMRPGRGTTAGPTRRNNKPFIIEFRHPRRRSVV